MVPEGAALSGRIPGGQPVTEPKTVAEQLDAAQTGEEFGAVVMGLFTALEKAMEDE